MKPFAFGVLAAVGFLAGCDRSEKIAPSNRDLGTGLNTVAQTYAQSPAPLFQEIVRVLEGNGLAVEDRKQDGLGGEITARRATGQKVTVKLRSVDEARTEASVRVEPGDRNLARMIHDEIARGVPPANVPEKRDQP